MFQRIIVPVDRSARSWQSVRIGAAIAHAVDAPLEIITVILDAHQLAIAEHELRADLRAVAPLDVETSLNVLVGSSAAGGNSVGAVIAHHAESVDGAMIVMSSTGRGRTAAVMGSTADEVLQAMFGPIIVVGPNATGFESFDGDIVVPVDGSEFSESTLPLAAAWGIGLGATPWIVEVLTEPTPAGVDVSESSYPNRLASALESKSHHDVEFEVLHGRSAGEEIADYANRSGARLIMMSTHGRTGLRRLAVGSTAASVVHRATCPVVLHRPPRFALDE